MIEMRFKEPQPTLEQIGAEFGITKERVRQIIAKHTGNGSGFVPKSSVEKTCPFCDTAFLKNSKFCSRKCAVFSTQNFPDLDGRPRCYRCGIQERLVKHTTKKYSTRYICTPCASDMARKWRSSKQGKEKIAKIAERQRTKWPEKTKARSTLNHALTAGKVTKPKQCSISGCKDTYLHAHHDDYKKPLKVRWLCAKCHKKLHMASKA